MPQHQGLVLNAKSEVKVAKVTSQGDSLQLSDIQKYLKKKTAVLLGKYSFKGTTLFLFGTKEGKAGTENKHELPPPLDADLFFGDILLMASKNATNFSNPIPFTSQEYENFYTKMFEGFEDLDNEDDEDGEDDNEDEDDDEDILEEEEIEQNDEYLDEDDALEDEEKEDEENDEEKPEDDAVQDDEEVPIINKVIKEKKVEKKSTKKTTKAAQILPQLPDFTNEPELVVESDENLQLPTHPIRKKVYELIQEMFKSYLQSQDSIVFEHHLYNAVLQLAEKKHIKKCWSHPVFEQMYKAHTRSVLLNFHPQQYTRNTSLMERYKEGKVTLEEIAKMSYNDLFPEIWRDLSFRQFEREKRQLEGNKSMATDQFRCHRCGKKECTYYELQTRSADEPMTIFIQCVNCGKHWRQ